MTVLFPLPSAQPLDLFAALVARDGEFALFEAAVSVGLVAEPLLDTQAVLAEVEDMAQRLKRRTAVDAAGAQRLRLLNHFFFRELGFAGNVNDYYDPGNSLLHRVIQTRRGIPITLALLYMEIGQAQGLKLAGVSFPGHFLVKCSLPQGEVVIDPMSGQSLSREDLDERLAPYRRRQGLVGDFEVPLGLFLQSATPREILARLLGNLKEIHRTQEDWEGLIPILDRLVLVVPDDAGQRRDRGLVLAELEQWAAAAADLAHYLDLVPDAPDAQALAERLVELQRLAQLH